MIRTIGTTTISGHGIKVWSENAYLWFDADAPSGDTFLGSMISASMDGEWYRVGEDGKTALHPERTVPEDVAEELGFILMCLEGHCFDDGEEVDLDTVDLDDLKETFNKAISR